MRPQLPDETSRLQPRTALLLLLGAGLIARLWYLVHNCPLDLSGDEAQYWDWSRQLQLSYYSKGPLAAWIIHASCAVLGDTPLAVRLPAVLLSLGTNAATYALVRRISSSDWMGFWAVALNHTVPLYLAGSFLMTIDPPYFFCWAVACLFAYRAFSEQRPRFWYIVGVAVGVGFLAKYAMLLWFAGLVVFLVLEPSCRRWLRNRHFWLGNLSALPFLLPVLIWNAASGWVGLGHVTSQTGMSRDGGFQLKNPFEFIGSQAGLVSIFVAAMVACGVVWWWRSRRALRAPMPATFLAALGLTFLAINLVTSFRTKVQANWPAPAYFTLIPLGFLWARGLWQSQAPKSARTMFIGTAVLAGIMVLPIHNMTPFYPALVRAGVKPRSADPSFRLLGWSELADHVSAIRRERNPDAMVFCVDYQVSALMGFYGSDHPKAFYTGSYSSDPKERRRLTQYDLWADRALDNPAHVGRDAVYVFEGDPSSGVTRAFERVDELAPFEVRRHGVLVRTFRVLYCHNFRGLARPDGVKRY